MRACYGLEGIARRIHLVIMLRIGGPLRLVKEEMRPVAVSLQNGSA